MATAAAAMADALAQCRRVYEADLAATTQCGLLRVEPSHRSANQRVFDALCYFQVQQQSNDGAGGSAGAGSPTIPTPEPALLQVLSEMEMPPSGRIVPIGDIHKRSDCDWLYRLLIPSKFDVSRAVRDAFRIQKFRDVWGLNTILWDPWLSQCWDEDELMCFQFVQAPLRLPPPTPKEAGRSGGFRKFFTSSKSPVVKEEAGLPKGTPTTDGNGSVSSVGDRSPELLRVEVEGGTGAPVTLKHALRASHVGFDKEGHVLFFDQPDPLLVDKIIHRFPLTALDKSYLPRDPAAGADGDGGQLGSPASPNTDLVPCTMPLELRQNLLVRLHLKTLEKGRRLARLHGVDRITCIMDAGGMTMSILSSTFFSKLLKLLRMVSEVGQLYYPENMNKLLVVNGGWAFAALYKLVKPWLDENTQKKIEVLPGTHKAADGKRAKSTPTEGSAAGGAAATERSELAKQLERFIDYRWIPECYGGDLAMCTRPIPPATRQLLPTGACRSPGSSGPDDLPPTPWASDTPAATAVKPREAKGAAATQQQQQLAALDAYSGLRQFLPDMLPDAFLTECSPPGQPVTEEERAAFESKLYSDILPPHSWMGEDRPSPSPP